MRLALARDLGVVVLGLLLVFSSNGAVVAGERHDLPPSRTFTLPQDAVTVVLAPIDHAAAIASESLLPISRPYRFGIEVPVDLAPWTVGEWFERGAFRIWRTRIESQNAFSLHLLFDAFRLSPQGRFYVYSDVPDSPIQGPFTARDNREDFVFATAPLPGAALTLEYVEPIDGPRGIFHVSHVVHGYRDAFAFAARAKAGTQNASGSCNVNVNCPQGASLQDVKQSVALLVIGGGTCSGVLLNNTAQDGARLLLTANHCAVGGPSPGQWSFVFNFESSTCIGSPGSKVDTVSGATLIQKGASADYCLVRINPAIPPAFKVYFAGYDATGAPVANSAGIHHPGGDLRKICFDNESAGKGTWNGADTWRIAKWDLGVTEPGSSGSPLFDPNKLVVGQLYGGTAACGNPIDDFYGRLETSVKNANVAAALDPLGNAPTTLQGVDGSIVISVNLAAVSLLGPIDAQVLETISVDFDVQSIGSYAPATYGYRLQLSADNVIDESDLVLDSGVLSSFGLINVLAPIPNAIAPGSYFLGLSIDPDPSEIELADNTLLGNAITVNPSTAPDLTALAVSGPLTAERGEVIDVNFEVAGNAFATLPATAEIRLSADDILTSTDALLGVLVLNAFGPSSGSVTVPVSLPAGTYRLGVLAVPAAGELSLADNTMTGELMTVTNPPPDVTAIGIDGPAKTKVGKKPKVRVQLDKGSFTGKVSYTIRLSLDPVITTEDLVVASFKTKKSGTIEIEPKIPNIAAGTYYWGVTIDSVAEEIEFSNNSVAGDPVLVKPKN